MKPALVLTLFIAVAVISVTGTSPSSCAAVTCDQATCEVRHCRCGSYKDDCECCEFCHRCPGEPCSSLFRDPCTEGYRCTLSYPEQRFEAGAWGRCRSLNGTATEHQHHEHTEHKN